MVDAKYDYTIFSLSNLQVGAGSDFFETTNPNLEGRDLGF